MKQANGLRAQVKEEEKYLDLSKNQLRHVLEKLLKNKVDLGSVRNYSIQVCKSSLASK